MSFQNKAVVTVIAILGTAGFASAGEVFNQGFETDTSGWFDGSTGWYGTNTRVASGTGGITSFSGAHHATFEQSSLANPDDDTGGFTRFDGYRSSWNGQYSASAAVYLDIGWAAGEGFDYSVASSRSDGTHLRDFIFHITMDTSSGDLIVAGSNNTNFDPREDLETLNHTTIAASGWFTFEHVFRDAGDGTLAVDLNLYNASGTLVFTETRNTASDILATVVGGNRYGWFTNIDIAGGINVDDITLTVVPLPPAAIAGLAMLAGIAGVRTIRRR